MMRGAVDAKAFCCVSVSALLDLHWVEVVGLAGEQ